jgi:hypothetical protein
MARVAADVSTRAGCTTDVPDGPVLAPHAPPVAPPAPALGADTEAVLAEPA